jgi:uncharacterized protein YecE (DUF72 family)
MFVGTSGFSYDDWKHVYYPANVSRSGWLAYYATEFRAVELNFTYYRLPTSEQTQKIALQTPRDFRFTVKAHRDITHTRTGDPVVFAQFRAGIEPLQKEEKLGAILLQFPFSFRNVQENTYYLQHCARQLSGLPTVVEFRHSSWVTQRTLSKLREWEIGFCNVDMPKLPGLMPQTAFVTAPTAYARFHGRNAGKWWRHQHAWERYDYSYTDSEIAEWIPHLVDMDQEAENLYVFANNHWQGQAISTARQIKMHLERHSSEQ